MIKAIIFDMGGVLVDLDLEACRNAFKQELGYMNIDNVLDPCHQKGIIGDLEEGKIGAEEFRRAILAESKPGAGPEDVDRAFSRILAGIDQDKISLLKELSKDYDIYMLSNNNPVALPYAAKMFSDAGFSIEKDFKKCYMSFELKHLKPSQAFYKVVMDDIGLPAEQMIFIDDSMTNVEGAVSAGLPAVYYESGTDLRALVADILYA